MTGLYRFISLGCHILTGLYRFISLGCHILIGLYRFISLGCHILTGLYRFISLGCHILTGLYRFISLGCHILTGLYRFISLGCHILVHICTDVQLYLSDNDSHTVREITFFFFFSTYTTYDMTPSAHMSVENDTGSKLIISGAQNSAVPNSTLTVFPSSNF